MKLMCSKATVCSAENMTTPTVITCLNKRHVQSTWVHKSPGCGDIKRREAESAVWQLKRISSQWLHLWHMTDGRRRRKPRQVFCSFVIPLSFILQQSMMTQMATALINKDALISSQWTITRTSSRLDIALKWWQTTDKIDWMSEWKLRKRLL